MCRKHFHLCARRLVSNHFFFVPAPPNVLCAAGIITPPSQKYIQPVGFLSDESTRFCYPPSIFYFLFCCGGDERCARWARFCLHIKLMSHSSLYLWPRTQNRKQVPDERVSITLCSRLTISCKVTKWTHYGWWDLNNSLDELVVPQFSARRWR